MTNNLTRRQFLGLLTATALELILKPIPIIAATQGKVIPFEEALANPSARQQYIDQLVAHEYSPYVEKVIYDHDKQLAKKSIASDINRRYRNPEFLEQIVSEYLEDAKFKNLNSEEKNSKKTGLVQQLLTSSEIDTLTQQEYKKTESVIDGSNLFTSIDKLSFGKKVKPNVYVFGDAFKMYRGQIMLLPPTEELSRARLQHEYQHAEDFYLGINLSDSLRVDASNFFNINPEALVFVLEIRSYLRQIDFAKQFGINHSAYLRALNEFDIYFGDWQARNYLSDEFSAYDRALISHQWKQVEKIIPEVKRFRKTVEGVDDYDK